MNTSTPHRPFRLAAALLLPLAFCLAHTSAQAQGPDVDRCNENQGLDADALDDPFVADLTGIPLLPGQTVPTDGTNSIESPELHGKLAFQLTGKFNFHSASGTVKGGYSERNYSGAHKRCKQHLQIKVTQGCVRRVLIHNYVHPLDIVADFRDDIAGDVQSDVASRSGDGLVFEFHLFEPVCAGQTSRWLLLNTSVNTLTKSNQLELISDDGESSGLLPIHVPFVAQ